MDKPSTKWATTYRRQLEQQSTTCYHILHFIILIWRKTNWQHQENTINQNQFRLPILWIHSTNLAIIECKMCICECACVMWCAYFGLCASVRFDLYVCIIFWDDFNRFAWTTTLAYSIGTNPTAHGTSWYHRWLCDANRFYLSLSVSAYAAHQYTAQKSNRYIYICVSLAIRYIIECP